MVKGKSLRRVLLWGVVAICGVLLLLWVRGSPAPSDAADPGLVADRIWVEKEPESLRQLVHRALLVTQVRLGIFDESSFYKGHHEIFEWKRNGDRLKIVFPQDRRKTELSFTVSTCDELFPYDLCLDLSENPWGGPKRYYGMMDPEGEQLALQDRLRALVPRGRP